MLDANKSVTVSCSWYDGAADVDREVSFVLRGVSVHVESSVATSTGGITADDLVKIRIPYRKGYVPEDQWSQKKQTSWTLRIGEKIIVNDKTKTITRVRDNTSRRFEPHWYVEAQ